MSDMENVCIICFHPLHPKGICRMIDEFFLEYEGVERICGCNESISEEQRGQQIIVYN